MLNWIALVNTIGEFREGLAPFCDQNFSKIISRTTRKACRINFGVIYQSYMSGTAKIAHKSVLNNP